MPIKIFSVFIIIVFNSMIRICLYSLAGIISALIGWHISHIFITDFSILKEYREIIIFPWIAMSLAIGMVINELFMSNPTRIKLNFRILPFPILIALSLGLIIGLIAGGIFDILANPDLPKNLKLPDPILRCLGWLIIGIAVALAEGITWQFYSVEAGNRERFKNRLKTGVMGASIASLVAAILFELLRLPFKNSFGEVEDPIGFSILGLCLGVAFSITNSPSYIAALRAGKGFEYKSLSYEPFDPSLTQTIESYPSIKSPLKFVSKYLAQTDREGARIEEGLSIQLPATGTIRIGSADKANICIPGLPLHSADIRITQRDAILYPNSRYFHTIAINGTQLGTTEPVILKHNYLLAFYPLDEIQDKKYEQKIYRFVYYNRFLDPQS